MLCLSGTEVPCTATGFFNNVAIGALYVLNRLDYERIAVIDFDVHHGNGTEEILAADKRCQFASLHTYGPKDGKLFYPGTGGPNECASISLLPLRKKP